MIHGFDYEGLIKIGFLNYAAEENLENYKDSYDAIVMNDGSFNFVNDLIKEMK